MSTTLPPDLDQLQKQYKDHLVFFADLAEGPNKGHYSDLTLPVLKIIMITSGHSNGHWFLGLVQAQSADGTITKCTYINCKAGKLTPPNDGQTWVGPLSFNSTWYKYDLPVASGHSARDFLNVLLAPTAKLEDGVMQSIPMVYYQYATDPRTAGCRHWTESAARAFQRSGLMQDSADALQTKITEGGKLETANLTNPHGVFYSPAPLTDDQGPPYI